MDLADVQAIAHRNFIIPPGEFPSNGAGEATMERRTRNGLWVCGLVGLSITTAVLDACSSDAATEALEDGGVDAPVAPSPTSTGQPDSAPSAVDATTADAPAEAATSDGGTDAAPDAPPPYTLASLGSKLVLWLEGDTGLTSLSPGNDAIWKDLSSSATTPCRRMHRESPRRSTVATTAASTAMASSTSVAVSRST